MTVSLVSIRIPLPAASARYVRSVFFELEVVYSPSILVARILLVIFLNRNMYFTVLSLDLGLMFFFFQGEKGEAGILGQNGKAGDKVLV